MVVSAFEQLIILERQRRRLRHALIAILFASLAATTLQAQEGETRTQDQERRQAIRKAFEQLDSKSVEERSSAISTLSDYQVREAIPKLKPLLAKGQPEEIQRAALDALTAMDVVEIVPMVRPLLEAKDPELRYAAGRALVMFEDKESLPKVVKIYEQLLKTASCDDMLTINLLRLEPLLPALEKVLADDRDTIERRFQALLGIMRIGRKSSAPKVAAYLDEVEKSTLTGRERDENIAFCLQTLENTGPAPFLGVFRKYAASGSEKLVEFANRALIRLRDLNTRKRLVEEGRYELASGYLLDTKLEQKLRRTTLRLSQIEGHSLEEVMARFQDRLGIPIEISKELGAEVRSGRFGRYVGMLGVHLDAFTLLSMLNSATFSGGELKPIFTEKILLVSTEKAKQYWKRELINK